MLLSLLPVREISTGAFSIPKKKSVITKTREQESSKVDEFSQNSKAIKKRKNDFMGDAKDKEKKMKLSSEQSRDYIPEMLEYDDVTGIHVCAALRPVQSVLDGLIHLNTWARDVLSGQFEEYVDKAAKDRAIEATLSSPHVFGSPKAKTKDEVLIRSACLCLQLESYVREYAKWWARQKEASSQILPSRIRDKAENVLWSAVDRRLSHVMDVELLRETAREATKWFHNLQKDADSHKYRDQCSHRERDSPRTSEGRKMSVASSENSQESERIRQGEMKQRDKSFDRSIRSRSNQRKSEESVCDLNSFDRFESPHKKISSELRVDSINAKKENRKQNSGGNRRDNEERHDFRRDYRNSTDRKKDERRDYRESVDEDRERGRNTDRDRNYERNSDENRRERR